MAHITPHTLPAVHELCLASGSTMRLIRHFLFLMVTGTLHNNICLTNQQQAGMAVTSILSPGMIAPDNLILWPVLG